jgi:DNA-binding transcriptional MerR regulator
MSEMLDHAGVAAEGSEQLPAQGELFPEEALGKVGQGGGYRGPTACKIVGITYRQLDYWARTGLVVPTLRGARGSGSQRLYSFKDVLVLKVVKRLLDAGVSLQNIRVAVEHLRTRGIRDLAGTTLFSDGTTVYECGSPEEIVDLLRGGQGVFGIAIGGAMLEITGSIREFPVEPPLARLHSIPTPSSDSRHRYHRPWREGDATIA